MIWEELDPALIRLDVEAGSMEEVMEQVGRGLIICGYAKPSYVDALIERENGYPTGLDINGFGVAIPHTPIDHVNKSGVAIATLAQPVRFVQMGTEDEPVDVRLIFMLAVVDPMAHLAELQAIIKIVQDNATLEKLMACTSASEIIQTIKAKEEGEN